MKITKILFIAGLIIFPIIGLAQTSTTPNSTPTTINPATTYYCGDGKCDKIMGETTANCEKDCPQETTTLRWGNCGDKVCQPDESKSSCSVDCGYPWVCGDGICGGTETDWNCPQDCPKPEVPSVWCGDKICQSDESQRGCPIDCGYPLTCGDGICSDIDTYNNCPNDCSQPTTAPTLTPTTSTTFGGTTGGGYGTISTTPTPAVTTAGCVPGATHSVTTGAPCTTTTTVPTPTTSIAPVIFPQTTVVSSLPIKCGVSTLKICNECGAGVYKNVLVKCSDGSEVTLGSASSCKPVDLWDQYAKQACAEHCLSGGWGGWIDITSAPIICDAPPPVTTKPVEIPKVTPVCYISDNLMQQYNQLIAELQKPESDKARAEEITQQIISLKQQIATQQNECTGTPPQATPTVISRPVPPASPLIATENIPVGVSIDHCNEVAQWETKIAYYKKINNLNNDDLKKSGFSREEIEKILQELLLGIEKVRGQCGGQEKTPIMPRTTAITGSASIAETVKPVVVESGPEISAYYKAMIEKAVSVKGEEKQIQELKTLRDEIDGLISNLIKSRKELEVSELNTLVKEVKVSRGEIKADDISVKTTEKKMLINVGDRPVSVEPTASQVIIRDKELVVNTEAVMIKENVLSVGGVDVKMSASEVTEKLGLAPKTIELKEENSKAVYDIKIDERRKLFGFIPFDRERIVTADAENGNTLSENLPWYNFMTTK